MTFEEVQSHILSWLVTSSGLPASNVIEANQTAPKPGQDFIVINTLTYTEIGHVEESFNTDTELVVRKQDVELIIQIDCYGKFAFSIMRNVLKSLKKQEIKKLLEINEICITSDGVINNLKFLEGVQWQDRRQINITVNYTETTTEDVGYFDTIELEIDLPGTPDKSYPVLSGTIKKELHDLEINNLIDVSIEKVQTEEYNINYPISTSITSNEKDYEINNVISTIILRSQESLAQINDLISIYFNLYNYYIVSNALIYISTKIFEHDFKSLYDTSENGNHWIEIIGTRSETAIFEHNFITTSNDDTKNNNNWIEIITTSNDTRIFEHDFSSLNDLSNNNNNWIEITA